MKKKKRKLVTEDIFMLVFGFEYPMCKPNANKYVKPPSSSSRINQIISNK